MRRGFEGLGEKINELRSIHWQLKNSRGDIKYSIENTVANIVITVYGVGGY